MSYSYHAKILKALLLTIGKTSLLFSSLVIALGFFNLPVTAGTVKKISAVNTFFIKNGQVQTATTFEFNAHPSDKETINRAIALLPHRKRTSQTINSRKFKDDHKTTGQGWAVYRITKNQKQFILAEQVGAKINPHCPRKADDCGPVSMKTTTKNKTTITASGNEVTTKNIALLNDDIAPSALSEMFLDVSLSGGTKVSLARSESSQHSLGVNDSSNLLYNLSLSVVEDDSTPTKQQLIPELTMGIDDEYFSLNFDSDFQTIQNRIMDAFSYNENQNAWVVSEDVNLFSIELTPQQEIESFDLLGEDSEDQNSIETIPESSSPITLLAFGILGTGAIVKRHLKSAKISQKQSDHNSTDYPQKEVNKVG